MPLLQPQIIATPLNFRVPSHILPVNIALCEDDRPLVRIAVPHKDFSDLYEKMSGKGESAGEAHLRSTR
eukprot:COSAG02_NODE_36229_length_457_cov_0.997207_2_plen_68_part_01